MWVRDTDLWNGAGKKGAGWSVYRRRRAGRVACLRWCALPCWCAAARSGQHRTTPPHLDMDRKGLEPPANTDSCPTKLSRFDSKRNPSEPFLRNETRPVVSYYKRDGRNVINTTLVWGQEHIMDKGLIYQGYFVMFNNAIRHSFSRCFYPKQHKGEIWILICKSNALQLSCSHIRLRKLCLVYTVCVSNISSLNWQQTLHLSTKGRPTPRGDREEFILWAIKQVKLVF